MKFDSYSHSPFLFLVLFVLVHPENPLRMFEAELLVKLHYYPSLGSSSSVETFNYAETDDVLIGVSAVFESNESNI